MLLPVGAIVGIAVGGTALVVSAFFFPLFFYRQRSSPPPPPKPSTYGEEYTSGSDDLSFVSSTNGVLPSPPQSSYRENRGPVYTDELDAFKDDNLEARELLRHGVGRHDEPGDDLRVH